MNSEDFRELVHPEFYQVFLLAAALPIPLNFAVHGWFVIQHQGKAERWEFGRFNDSPHPNKIGVLKDFMAPTSGMRKYPWKTRKGTKTILIDSIAGPKDSLAHKMYNFIQKETPLYPLRNRYTLTGPNSNTYIQWVINHFPESTFKLPFNAFGKNYRTEITSIN